MSVLGQTLTTRVAGGESARVRCGHLTRERRTCRFDPKWTSPAALQEIANETREIPDLRLRLRMREWEQPDFRRGGIEAHSGKPRDAGPEGTQCGFVRGV
jgi:hypothetical protein